MSGEIIIGKDKISWEQKESHYSFFVNEEFKTSCDLVEFRDTLVELECELENKEIVHG